MKIELSEMQVKMLIEIINKTNFSGQNIEVIAKLKLDLLEPLKETEEKKDK